MSNAIEQKANEYNAKVKQIGNNLNSSDLDKLQNITQDASLWIFDVLNEWELVVNDSVKWTIENIQNKLTTVLEKDLKNIETKNDKLLWEKEDVFDNKGKNTGKKDKYQWSERLDMEQKKEKIESILWKVEAAKNSIKDVLWKIELLKLTPNEIISKKVTIWDNEIIDLKNELIDVHKTSSPEFSLIWIDGEKAKINPDSIEVRLKNKDGNIKPYILDKVTLNKSTWELNFDTWFSILTKNWDLADDIDFNDYLTFGTQARISGWSVWTVVNQKMLQLNLKSKLDNKSHRKSLMAGLSSDMNSFYDWDEETYKKESIRKMLEDRDFNNYKSFSDEKKNALIDLLINDSDVFDGISSSDIKNENGLKDFILKRMKWSENIQTDADFQKLFNKEKSKLTHEFLVKNIEKLVESKNGSALIRKNKEYSQSIDKNKFKEWNEIDTTSEKIKQWTQKEIEFEDEILWDNLDGDSIDLKLQWVDGKDIVPNTSNEYVCKINIWWTQKEVKIKWLDLSNLSDYKITFGSDFKILDKSGNVMKDISFDDPIEFKIFSKIQNKHTKKEYNLNKTIKFDIESKLKDRTDRESLFVDSEYEPSIKSAYDSHTAKVREAAIKDWFSKNTSSVFNSMSSQEQDNLIKNLAKSAKIFWKNNQSDVNKSAKDLNKLKKYLIDKKTDQGYWQDDTEFKNYLKEDLLDDANYIVKQNLIDEIDSKEVSDFLTKLNKNKFKEWDEIDKTRSPIETWIWWDIDIKANILRGGNLPSSEKLKISLDDSTQISPTKHKIKIKDSKGEREVIFDDFKIDYKKNGSDIKLHYWSNFRILDDDDNPIWDIDLENPIEFDIEAKILNSDTKKESTVKKTMKVKIDLEVDDTMKDVILTWLNWTGNINQKLEYEYDTKLNNKLKEVIFDKMDKWWIGGIIKDEQKKSFIKYLKSKHSFGDRSVLTDFVNFQTFMNDKNTKKYQYSEADYTIYMIWNLEKNIWEFFDNNLWDELEWIKIDIASEITEFTNNLDEYKKDNNIERKKASSSFNRHLNKVKNSMKWKNYCKFFVNQSYSVPEQSVIIDTETNEDVKYSMDLKVNAPNSFELRIKIGDDEKILVWDSHFALVEDLLNNPDISQDKVRLHAAFNVYKAMIWMAQNANLKLTRKQWRSRKTMYLSGDKIVFEDNKMVAWRSSTKTFDVNEKDFMQTDNLESFRTWLESVSKSFHDIMQWEYDNYREATKWKFMLMRKNTKTRLPNSWMLSPLKTIFNKNKNLNFDFDTSIQIWDRNFDIKYEWTKFTISDGEKEFTKRNLSAILRKPNFDGFERDIIGKIYEQLTQKLLTNPTIKQRTYYVFDKYSKRTYVFNNWQVWYINEENKKIWKDGYFRKGRWVITSKFSAMTLLEWDKAMELYKDPYLMWKMVKTMSKSLRRWPVVDIIPDWMKGK